MNLLHVISSMDPAKGGTSQVLRTSYSVFSRFGVCVEIVCLDSPTSDYLHNDKDICIHALGESWGIWQYNSKLYKWLDENIHRFDVVIINGLWLYHSYVTINVYNKLKRSGLSYPKIFVMPHGMLDPWFQLEVKRRWKAIRNRFYWSLVENKVIKEVDALLFTSEQEMSLANVAFKNYQPKKVFNVGLGIQPPPVLTFEIQRAFFLQYPQLENKKYWLFLSRIDYKKGLDLLLLAYQKLYYEFQTDINFPKLVVAGPSSDSGYMKLINTIVQAFPESKEQVFFTGMLTGSEKWGAMYGCEAFVLPSHQENFGIAVVEALACSKPVLITNKLNIWCEIESCNAGVVSDDDIQSVYRMLKKFYTQNDEIKENMCLNAKKTFDNHFKIEYYIKRIMDVLDKVPSAT